MSRVHTESRLLKTKRDRVHDLAQGEAFDD